MIEYFYENRFKPYHVYNIGEPAAVNKIIKKILKDDQVKIRGENNKKNFKLVNKNYKIRYVTRNDSIFIENTMQEMKYGDLEVDNKNSFYLGRHIIRNGDRPQRISRSYPPMSECYHLNKELFDQCDISVDRNVVMGGCFKSNKVTLQRTMIPEEDTPVSGLPSLQTVKTFGPAIKSAIRKMQIEQLSGFEIDDINLTAFNSKTFPGFHLFQYRNKRNKGEAAAEAKFLAKERWKRIDEAFLKGEKLQRNKLFPNTFVVGARNKREHYFEDNEELSSRAVHMPEFHTEINSSIWVDQVTNHLKVKSKGPIYIGNSIVTYDRLVKDLAEMGKTVEGDWKRFDSRLYITNVIIGISILRLYYPIDDERIDAHFIAMFDTIGIKDYITPGGHVYRMFHGLPSGVCSTSVLGSIINLVNLLYCTQDTSSKKLKFIVGGDDFLVCLPKDANSEEIKNLMEERAREIGQTFKIIEIKDINSTKILERPCFYKYTIDRGEPVVYPAAFLERTFMPWNRNYDSDFKILEFLNDLIPSLGAPRSYHVIFYYFYQEMFRKVAERHMPIQEILLKHLSIYQRVMSGERFYKKDSEKFFKNFSQVEVSEEDLRKRLEWYVKYDYTKVSKLKIKRKRENKAGKV